MPSSTKPALTDEERRAIAALKRLAKRWPESLWIFAGGSVGGVSVAILKCDEDGARVYEPGGCVDQSRVVAHVDLPNDGGDW